MATLRPILEVATAHFGTSQAPLTGEACVGRIITDLAVVDIGPAGLVLREIAPGITDAQVRAATQPAMAEALGLYEMALGPAS